MTNIRGAVQQRNNNQQQQSTSMAGLIQQMVPEMDRVLPKHMTGDRMARLLLTAVRQNPKLAGCDPHSFAGAILTASALGLEPNTPNAEAYLIPYGKECQLVVGYAGLIKLFWQSPLAQHIDAQAVHENDDFDYAYGLDPYLRHKPALGDRGQVVAYYGVASLNTGAKHFVVLSPDEVKALRQGKVGPSGKIADPMHWMERKTVLRQLLKTLPKSANLSGAISADETNGSTLRARQLGQPVQPAAPVADAPDGVDTTTGEIDDAYVEAEFMDEPAEADEDAADAAWVAGANN